MVVVMVVLLGLLGLKNNTPNAKGDQPLTNKNNDSVIDPRMTQTLQPG